MGAWDSFWQGAQMGEHYGDMARNRRAYQNGGGLDAVAEAAGEVGDLEGMETAREMTRRQRRFADDERQRGYERMNTIAPWARNVIRAARNQPPERARPFLVQNQQRFLDFGLTPEQVQAGIDGLTNADPSVRAQWADDLDMAFSQHEDPNWQLTTVPREDGQGVEQRAMALGPNGEILRGEGSLPVPPGEIQQLGSGGLWRQDPNSPQGYEVLREPRAAGGGGGGGGEYRILSPEEAQDMGLPEGRTYQESPRGQVTVVGGAPPMLAGAEQRGRIALSFSNIVEAQEALDRMDSAAVRRQGSHGSDTPLGQDWGARIAEAVPFDGGSIARFVGGSDYQQYEAASRLFEQSVMPIFSGSAVTESEAQRFVRANLPRMNDGRETLEVKARNRARIINAAATILGEPPPYLDAGTWSPSSGLLRPTETEPQQNAPSTANGGSPQPGTIEDGFRFRGGSPADPNNWEPVR